MANDLIRPAVTLYRETDPKIDMMAPVTTMNRIAQVIQRRSWNNITLYITCQSKKLHVIRTFFRSGVGLGGRGGIGFFLISIGFIQIPSQTIYVK